MDRLSLLIFFCGAFTLKAQSDTVYMSVYNGHIANRYQILVQENDRWIREDYAHFKTTFLTETVVLPDTLHISGQVYEEKRGKYTHIYKPYAMCDPAINQIRNAALYHRKENFIDSSARSKISYDNKAFRDFSNKKEGELRSSSAFFKADCYDQFSEKLEILMQEELTFIDSVYDSKVKRAALASSNPAIIDSAFIHDFLSTFNETDPDLRTLERIMVHQPEMLLTAVNSIYPETSYVFMWKLDKFPKDLDLSAAKTALQQTKQRNPIKRKVIRKMKNKE